MRRVYIDWLRGVAVLAMIEWHVFDSWTMQGATRDTDLWSVIMYIGGLAAPLFLFLAGLAIGLPVVVGTTRLMGGMLFEVSPYDWTSLLGATGVLLLVASAAGLFPAWRASCVDPMVALRQD